MIAAGTKYSAQRSQDSRLSVAVQAWERREVAQLTAMYTSHLLQLEGIGSC